jgi:DNA-binding CsgD family transcriptional regulator
VPTSDLDNRSDVPRAGRAPTPRQREVLRLLAAGLSMKEAGRVLNITPRTVAFHKYQMMAQLKLNSNAALIQYAVRQGIV